MIAVAPLRAPPPRARAFAGILLTSANALAVLDADGRAALAGLARGGPVLAVGSRTAEAARAAGLGGVVDAGGDAAALAARVAAALPPGSALLHVTGRPRKREPAAALRAAGYPVTAWVTYAAGPVPRLPESAAAALAAGALDAALHYSRRSAEAALGLVRDAGHAAAFGALRHHCLSGDVAAPLVAAGIACHVVAARPDEAALLAGLPPP